MRGGRGKGRERKRGNRRKGGEKPHKKLWLNILLCLIADSTMTFGVSLVLARVCLGVESLE